MNTTPLIPRYGFRYVIIGMLLVFTFDMACAKDLSPTPSVSGSGSGEQSTDAQTLLKLADSYIRQAQYKQALELLTRAYEISKTLKDGDIKNKILDSMANVYYNTGQLEQAHRYYSELISLDKASGNQASLAVSLFNLGHVNASRKQFKEANDNFEQSLMISKSLDDKSGTAYTLKAMGANAHAQSDLAVARSYLETSLQRFKEINDTMQVAVVHRHLGDIAREEGNYEAAIMHYETALPILVQGDSNTPLMRTYRGLSAAYEKLRDFEKAFASHRTYTQLLQQQLEQQNLETTQRLQVQFETHKFAAANERLELTNQSQQQELEHRKTFMKMQYIVLGLAIGIIVLVAILWWRSRRHAHKMQMLATTDEMTGLLNRRAILQFGVQEWRRADRFKRPLCCLLFDVDNFKNINDSFGHAAGDQVLKTISAVVKSTLRQTDSLGRFGGEEFLLMATETEVQQAEILAERIRHKIESISHKGMADRIVTVSIGIAQLTDETSLEELIRHADEALYVAKNNGRNQIAISKG